MPIKEDLQVFDVRQLICFAHPDRDRETAVRHRCGSQKRLFRSCITFGGAVIVVNMVHRWMAMSPETEFGSETVRRTIKITFVKFVLEALCRAIPVAPNMIRPQSHTVKFVNRRFVPFLKMAAAVPAALAGAFALGP